MDTRRYRLMEMDRHFMSPHAGCPDVKINQQVKFNIGKKKMTGKATCNVNIANGAVDVKGTDGKKYLLIWYSNNNGWTVNQ